MLTKIISFFILLLIGYVLTVFFAPEVSTRIDSFLGISGLSNTFHDSKQKLDYVSTDGVSTVLKNATEFRDGAREALDTTKDKIDTVRQQGQKIEAGYEELQENIDTLKGVYDSTTEAIGQVSESLESLTTLSGASKTE